MAPKYNSNGCIRNTSVPQTGSHREGQTHSKHLATLLSWDESNISALTIFRICSTQHLGQPRSRGRGTGHAPAQCYLPASKETRRRPLSNTGESENLCTALCMSFVTKDNFSHLNHGHARVNHFCSPALPVLTSGLCFLALPGLAVTKTNIFRHNFFSLKKRQTGLQQITFKIINWQCRN